MSSASLEGSLRSEGPSPASVSNGVVSIELRIQPTSIRQNSLLFGDLYSGAIELGERICLIPTSLVSKPFQSYYRKAREGRAVHLDESLIAKDFTSMKNQFSIPKLRQPT
jgi:hypothetical protein